MIHFLSPPSYEMLQDNVDGYRREIASLREKIQKMSTTAQKHEQIIHTMTQDLRVANEKLAVTEVRSQAALWLGSVAWRSVRSRCGEFCCFPPSF